LGATTAVHYLENRGGTHYIGDRRCGATSCTDGGDLAAPPSQSFAVAHHPGRGYKAFSYETNASGTAVAVTTPSSGGSTFTALDLGEGHRPTVHYLPDGGTRLTVLFDTAGGAANREPDEIYWVPACF
jgi:hypothetical protein